MTDIVDVCVVGGGPGGLAAATWLGRYRRSVIVLDSQEHRNRWVGQAHGYLGSDPVSPGTLLDRARADLGQYRTVRLRTAKAVAAQCSLDGVFAITTEGGEQIHARRLVLAMGVRDEFPDVPNFFDFYGTSIFHCPSCDGYETQNRPVVVFGWSEDIAGFARGLLDWAASVMVVTDGRRFQGEHEHRAMLADLGVAVVEDEVIELCGKNGDLAEVRLRDGGVISCERAFFSIAHHPRTWLGEQLGCELTGDGYLQVDHEGRTTVPGVYAAGDITPGMQYIQAAAADGAKAGTACALSLRHEVLGGATGVHDTPEAQALIGADGQAPDSP